MRGFQLRSHMRSTTSHTSSLLFWTQRQRRLYFPSLTCQYQAQRPGRQMAKSINLQELLCSRSQPKIQAKRQPADQYTRLFDKRVALMNPGDISVMQEADRGRQIPIPTPQKNLATRKLPQFQQTQLNNPKTVCSMALQLTKEYRPYLSEQICTQEPTVTPKQTTVMSRDCQKVESAHYWVRMGRSRPRAIVQQPQLKRRRQRGRDSFYWAWPQPICQVRRVLRWSWTGSFALRRQLSSIRFIKCLLSSAVSF